MGITNFDELEVDSIVADSIETDSIADGTTKLLVGNTNGTTAVDLYTAPVAITVTGIYLISLDTTAGNITVVNGSDTLATIAKGTSAGTLVGASTLANTSIAAGETLQLDSSSAGNATVFVTFTID